MDDFYLPDEDELGIELMVNTPFVEGLQRTISSENNNINETATSYTSMENHHERHTNHKQLMPSTIKTSMLDHQTSEPLILSFGNPDHLLYYKESNTGAEIPGDLMSSSSLVFSINSSNTNQFYEDEIKCREWSKEYLSGATTKPAPQLRDHVLAERKRRENLNKLFIALSSIIPGLKKVFFFAKHFSFCIKDS